MTSADGVFFREGIVRATFAPPLLEFLGENLVRPAGRAVVTTQCHILVGGVALGSRLSCLAMVEVPLFPVQGSKVKYLRCLRSLSKSTPYDFYVIVISRAVGRF